MHGGTKGAAGDVLCGSELSELIHCASKSAAVIAGCMVVAEKVQASQHRSQQVCSLLLNEKPLAMRLNDAMHDQCS